VRAIGPAVDVYALGAILYETLTGRPPFRAETPAETVRQVIDQDPAPPSRLNARVPRDLETICLKCLEKDPHRRYATARALAEDLRAWLEGRPMAARRASAAERFGRWCRRNPALAALAAAVVVVALGATLAAFRFRAVSRELESNLYFSDITLAHRELSQDNLGRAQKLLDDCPPGLRQWEWYYLTRLCRVDPIVFRDEAEVFSVAFSPDGERLASAGADGTIRVRNSRTGEVLQTLNANTDFVAYSVAFHPGGHHLAAAGADPRVKQVKVWDLTTEKVVFARPGSVDTTGRAHGVAFSPDGRRLASGSGGEVHVWDWSNDQRLYILPGHFKGGISVAFSPDGRRLASASWNGDIMIWDAETGQRLHILSEHHHSVSALAFSRDGRRLVSASFDHHLIAWDATKGQRLRILPGHDGLVTDVAFSPDDRYLASVGEDKVVRLWEAASGREVLSLRGHTKWCRSVAFSPDGRRIASAGWDATIRLWDATPLRGDEDQGVLTFSQHADEVSTMAISPDGQRVASAGPAAGRIALPVRVWDVRSGLVSTEFTGHAVAVFSAAWHPDGRRIASSGWNEGRTRIVVKVWDAQTARDAFGLAPGPGGETFAMAFSPDGRHLVTGGSSRVVQVWDAQTGEFVSTLGAHDRAIRGLAFSPDGRHLASVSGDSKMKLWDATRLTEAQEARRTVPVWVSWFPFNLAFSPDGRHLVAGGEKNTVGIWDVQTGEEIRILEGHSGDVCAAAFSPDPGGRWVASAGEDTTVKIWDSRTGRLVRSFRGHTRLVTSIAFSPDGRLLLSGSRDGTVKVWDLTHLEKKLHKLSAEAADVQGGESGGDLRDRDPITDSITAVAR
jgi:WD40 repeat protein